MTAIATRTIGETMRAEHDAAKNGCNCKLLEPRGCAYRKGRTRGDEERCPDCGYVAVIGTEGWMGHENLCGEPDEPPELW